jgi:hypothetical protein
VYPNSREDSPPASLETPCFARKYRASQGRQRRGECKEENVAGFLIPEYRNEKSRYGFLKEDQEKEEAIPLSKPLLPLFPPSRNRGVYFGHGTPWTK